MSETINSLRKTARTAGLIYFVSAVIGFFNLMIIPNKIFVKDNVQATANNIISHEGLLRLNIVSGVISSILFIILGLLLYKLFEGVDKGLARMMAALVLVMITVGIANDISQWGVLNVLTDNGYMKAFDPDKRNATMMMFSNLHDNGIYMCEIFWGLWLYPFGFLIIKSGFIPKILGVLLFVAGVGYLISSFTTMLIPHYHNDIVSRICSILQIGELPIIFWLLFIGTKRNTV
jgi:hypothetical protein